MVISKHFAFCLTLVLLLAWLTSVGCGDSQNVVIQPTQEILDAEASYADDYADEQQASYAE